MASITKIIKFSKQLPVKPTNTNFTNIVRTAINMRDYMPGPHPKTEAERLKAARKYNVHPDEYVPFPENDKYGFGWGDYPNLPVIGHAAKDPYYPWDFPVERRNYKEAVPEDYEILSPDKLDMLGTKVRVSDGEAILVFFGMVFTYIFLYWLGSGYEYFPEVMEKQWPKEGVTHYTFEPAK